MRLKRLSAHGFKSFADRTEFEFGADLIGIIGPNGCGKSNVVDAIKWALGAQRPTSLRGKEMTDVIFKGAEGREAMGYADVQLTFETFSEIPPASAVAERMERMSDRSEVTVGRRLFKDKESDYLLNGAPVRLKDIKDLLLDTGLGVGAYSVMEQGKIDAVLSANPEDRRSIFEEAAGISHFKVQRKEVLRRLEKTEANLARIKDVVDERGRRLKTLKAQASRARKYREVFSRLRDLRVATAVVERTELSRELAAVRERLVATMQAEERVRLAREENRGTSARLASERDRVRQEVADLAASVQRIEAEESGARHRFESLVRRRAEVERDRSEALARREDLSLSRTRGEEEARRLSSRGVELGLEVTRLEEESFSRKAAVRQARESVRALHDERERLRGELLGLLHERTRYKNQATEQEILIRSLDARLTRLTAQLAGTEAEQAACVDARSRLDGALADLAERRALLEADLGAASKRSRDLERELGEVRVLVAERREALSVLTSRSAALEELERSLAGMDQAPRALLEDPRPASPVPADPGSADPGPADHGPGEPESAAPDPGPIVCRLVDCIECDVAWSKALEAALGLRVQALLVQDRAAAESLLARAAERGLGRVIFALAAAAPAPEPSLALDPASIPGVRGWLRPLARCRDEHAPVVDRLLAGVLLVDSLDVAAEVGRRVSTSLVCVTPDGACMEGDLIVSGGQIDATAGLVQRRSALADLARRVQLARAELDGLKDDATGRESMLADLRAQETLLSRSLEGVKLKEHEDATEERRISERARDLAREREVAGLERDEHEQARLTALGVLGRDLLDVELIRRKETALEARTREASAAHEAASRTLAESQETEHDLQVDLATRTGEKDAAAEQLAMLERSLAEQAALMEGLLADAEAAAEKIDAGDREAAELAARREALVADRAACAEELVQRRSLLARADAELAGETGAALTLEREHAELQASRTQAMLAERELFLHREREEEKILADFGVEIARLAGEVSGRGILTDEHPHGPEVPPEVQVEQLLGPPLPPGYYQSEDACSRLWEDAEADHQAWRAESETLQARIDRLGPVNLEAIQELESEEEKLSFLIREEEDLREARKNLVETLRRINTESRALFEATFIEARNNFQAIFRKLFQGGRADITLTETDDPLEAGIDIMAKPPGKELQSINLLSGGERSLTALALLFGVFKVKPSPLCILDEVDAALDDTNVDRFLRVLQEFVGPTQFLVVTHHKRTMLACQVLYGITMFKKGVTTRLAVRLEDVQEGRATDFVEGKQDALPPPRIPTEALP